MIDPVEIIYDKVKTIMDTWSESDLYAVSFFVYSNETYEYKNYSNVSYFGISYNTERDCEGAGLYDEERWNYAFWRQDEAPIIDPAEPSELNELLFDWYQEIGITDPGVEDPNCYDNRGMFIGKGPAGHYELLMLASEVAKRFQQEGYLEALFGKKLPILIHGLEYAWFDLEATQKANPHGEADIFFAALKKLGMIP